MKWIAVSVITLTVALVGSFWLMWKLAFGAAKCTGVDPWAAMALVTVAVALLYFLFNGMDWINDSITARAVRQNSNTAYKEMQDRYRALSSQVRTMQTVGRMQDQMAGNDMGPGGLVSDDDFLDLAAYE